MGLEFGYGLGRCYAPKTAQLVGRPPLHTIRKDAEAHTDYMYFSLDPVHEDELPFTLSIEVLIHPKSTSWLWYWFRVRCFKSNFGSNFSRHVNNLAELFFGYPQKCYILLSLTLWENFVDVAKIKQYIGCEIDKNSANIDTKGPYLNELLGTSTNLYAKWWYQKTE